MGDWNLHSPAQQFSMIGKDVLARPIAVYPSLSANVKGAWVALTEASPIAATGFTLQIPYVYEGSDYLVDVGVGVAGGEQTILPNITVSAGATYSAFQEFALHVPMQIPLGSRIAVRCQATGTSVNRQIRCCINLENGTETTVNAVTTIGAVTADSGGTQIDPGATDNTKGSWVQVSASTAADIFGLFLGFGNIVNTSRTNNYWLVDLGIGGAGAEQIIIPDFVLASYSGTHCIYPGRSPIFDVQIPAGSRIAVRAASTIVDATDRLFDIIIYGLA